MLGISLVGFCYFNPRSPRGERRNKPDTLHYYQLFQSTLPARGATRACAPSSARQGRFQSTLPARGATLRLLLFGHKQVHFNPRSPRGERQLYSVLRVRKFAISIHAPREGSDVTVIFDWLLDLDFNPRSPRGERHLPIRQSGLMV